MCSKFVYASLNWMLWFIIQLLKNWVVLPIFNSTCISSQLMHRLMVGVWKEVVSSYNVLPGLFGNQMCLYLFSEWLHSKAEWGDCLNTGTLAPFFTSECPANHGVKWVCGIVGLGKLQSDTAPVIRKISGEVFQKLFDHLTRKYRWLKSI